MTEETITITKKEYTQLVKNSLLLRSLYHTGVDSWIWYGDACDIYEELLKERGLD